MKKYFLIAKHEFKTNVKRKEFLLMTVGMPLFMFAIIALPVLFMGNMGGGEGVKIGYVDAANGFHSQNFVKYSDHESAKKALFDGEITHFFVVPVDYLSTGQINIYSTNKITSSGSGKVEKQIKSFLLENLLSGESEELVERVKQPMQSEYFTLGGDKEEKEGIGAFLFPIGFAMLFVLSIFTSSGYLLQGIVEEKENRIIEILLSSVSHKELLSGKIIGLGAVGLAQLLVWLAGALLIFSSAPVVVVGLIGNLHISPLVGVLAPIYFILGYLVFASIMAGVGAVSTTSREGQQLAGVFSMSGVIPLFFLQFIIMSPNAIFARILSFFPLTSPLTMILRLSITEVPVYDIVISLIILIASTLGVIELSSRVFRAGLLMYGKKPTIKEVIKYVREN
ncbi:MAG: ABC-2 family transporter protein [Candidatus Argoarchaeum ethanivorans]|uniref:ABC-2 family transporter protein n=1 Tax=Candidatus Argoarchaeum ethanivorans TaxID=2608793 RepID=A0A811T892_9EURY|nr:MAG: ABC-2 family transporter protein [Candidatus Argoarchaeum ethanivorans]